MGCWRIITKPTSIPVLLDSMIRIETPRQSAMIVNLIYSFYAENLCFSKEKRGAGAGRSSSRLSLWTDLNID